MKIIFTFLLLCNIAQAQVAGPFRPLQPPGALGDTASIAVTNTAQFINCDVSLTPGTFAGQMRVEVIGTQPVTLSIGQVSAPPAVATVGNFIEMLPNTVEIFTINQNPRLSVIAPAPGSFLRCTTGQGD